MLREKNRLTLLRPLFLEKSIRKKAFRNGFDIIGQQSDLLIAYFISHRPENSDDGLKLRGKQLIFEWADFCMACQEGELELKPGGNYRFSGQGVEFGGGFEVRADFAKITKTWHEQIILELVGHAEIKFNGTKVTADKIKVFCDDSKFYLEGNATITQTIANDGPKSTTGQKLLFDADRETILVIED